MKKIISIILFFITAVSLDTAAQSLLLRKNSNTQSLLPRKNFGIIVSDIPANSQSSPLENFPTDSPSYKQKLQFDSIVSIHFYKKEYRKDTLVEQREITTFCNAQGKMFFEFLSRIKPNKVTDILLLFSNGSIYKTWHTPFTDDYCWQWKFYKYPSKLNNMETPILLIYEDHSRKKEQQSNQDSERLPIHHNSKYYKFLEHYFIYSYKIKGQL